MHRQNATFRTRLILPSVVMGFCLLGSVGCASKKAAVKSKSPEDKLAGQIHRSAAEGEKVTSHDLNRDRKPDVWSFTIQGATNDGKTSQRLVRKELDINWDGRVDITRNYDDSEAVQRESLDLDFDGRIDQINYYESGALVRKERDLDYNGKTDEWVFFDKGKIVRKERDTDSNGKTDYWEYWEVDQVDRIGEDLDGDGAVDRWTKNPKNSTGS